MCVKIFLFTLFIPFIYAKENCNKLNVLLTGNLENEGFHRIIHWLIETESKELNMLQTAECKVALKQEIPAGLYMDPDQIADLIRVQKLLAVTIGKIDVEKPAHLSEPHSVYVYYGNLTNKLSVELPVHLRYQRAQITGGHGKVQLTLPSLLINCEKDLPICSESTVDAPCTYENTNICKWKNISYQDVTNDIKMLVPIGDLDHYPLVSIITLLVSCAGCLYILSILSTTVL